MTYFDTAYLVKCYVKEAGWKQVRALARRVELVACSLYGRIELAAACHFGVEGRNVLGTG